MCTNHHYLGRPLVSDLTENVNSRKTQKSPSFVLSEARKEGIPLERACFCSAPNPVSRGKRLGGVEWSLALWSEWSAYLQSFPRPPPLPPRACFFCSVLFWTSFRSKRMFVVSGLGALKDPWKPNSLKFMFMHTNVSRTHLAFTDNLKLPISYKSWVCLSLALARVF